MPEGTEHYVTLFDSNFLPLGLALLESLDSFAMPYHLWVIATDDLVVRQLSQMNLIRVTVVPVSELETEALRATRQSRTRGEYSWTLTPFCPEKILQLAPDADRVTYLDADLYFFDSPQEIFQEFLASGKDVLITEHAYAPIYDRSAKNGRFCVQFITCRRTPGSQRVLHWWQERCLEWCYAKYEDGKFGDQKYLDLWPLLFPENIHICSKTSRLLAPWNVDYFSRRSLAQPIFYHFQGFRILSDTRVKLYHGFHIAERNLWLYEKYLTSVVRALHEIINLGYKFPSMPEHYQKLKWLKYVIMRATRTINFRDLTPMLHDAASSCSVKSSLGARTRPGNSSDKEI